MATALVFVSQISRGQQVDTTAQIQHYFAEWRVAASRDAGRLWGKPLYGPFLLLDPASRLSWANVPDSAGLLRARGGLFAGRLPAELNAANTAFSWAGRRWSTALLPLPTNRFERLNLLAHEAFHRLQPSLGLEFSEPDNRHLDQETGRVYLRLELAALRQAVSAPTLGQANRHLRAALVFRACRRRLYPGAAANENRLEMNEGLAEYTGLLLSGRSAAQTRQHLLASSRLFERNPSFVRSFAYCTVPFYGYLLRLRTPSWNRHLTSRTDLTALFSTAFRLPPAIPPFSRTSALQAAYGGPAIVAEERKREQQRQARLAAYHRQFQQKPYLAILLRKMNISFDPRNTVPLDTAGTVYPTLRVADEWGVLTANDGALISADWTRLTVASPTDTVSAAIAGPGYTLQLRPGWRLHRDPAGNYRLRPVTIAK